MVSCAGVRVSPAGIPRGCGWTLRAPACRVCACAAGPAVSRGGVLVASGCVRARVGAGRWRAFFVVWRLGGQKSFRTTRICDQNFRASPPVGWRRSEAGRAGLCSSGATLAGGVGGRRPPTGGRPGDAGVASVRTPPAQEKRRGGGTHPLPGAGGWPAPASAHELCSPGDAGTRMQTRNRGDALGRSPGRRPLSTSCRLWRAGASALELQGLVLPEGPGKALRALPAPFPCRLPGRIG